MPTYEKDINILTFSADESEAFCCPICGGSPDYEAPEVIDSVQVKYLWHCGECGAEGREYLDFVFDEHRVDVSSLSEDMQNEYTGVKTMCINGLLRVGDLVLSTIDNGGIPCLPGIVKAIDLLGTPEHDTENDTDDVHVDFTGDFGERRKREIVDAYTALYGYERPYEEIGHDYLIMDPTSLINITGIEEDKLRWIMESEENAIRYNYTVLRSMVSDNNKLSIDNAN